MKIIDHTPYFTESGEISAMDKMKAMVKYGGSWLPEMEGQKAFMGYLQTHCEKGYTLLRNVTLSGLGIEIPLILVGPGGIYVFHVTALRGMYRAKGETWGTLAGSDIKPDKVNLLTRTARLGRAVQVYLQRQGAPELPTVEAVLLCADAGMHADTVRPIIRVVQRDAFERLAVSIGQARPVVTPEEAHRVVEMFLNPRTALAVSKAAAAQVPTAFSGPKNEAYFPPGATNYFGKPETPAAPLPTGENLGFEFKEEGAAEPVPGAYDGAAVAPFTDALPADTFTAEVAQADFSAAGATPAPSKPARKGALSRKQLILLAALGLVECLVLVAAVAIFRPLLLP